MDGIAPFGGSISPAHVAEVFPLRGALCKFDRPSFLGVFQDHFVLRLAALHFDGCRTCDSRLL